MNESIVGIIGGMGPEATAFYYMKLIQATKVHKDQDHFRVIIDGNAKIPDRTKAILYGGPTPLPFLLESVNTLNQAGVQVGFVTCMTSHYFMEEMKQVATFRLINAFEELNDYIREKYPQVERLGILSTTGSMKTGLFDRYLKDFGRIYPDALSQENKVMDAIYSPEHGIKGGYTTGKPVQLLQEAGEELVSKGAQVIIAGCTEIGLVMKDGDFSVPLIDPMDAAISAIVNNKYQENINGN